MTYYYGHELYHHGIVGQKWGVRNGPPYPLNSSSKSSAEKSKSSASTFPSKSTGVKNASSLGSLKIKKAKDLTPLEQSKFSEYFGKFESTTSSDSRSEKKKYGMTREQLDSAIIKCFSHDYDYKGVSYNHNNLDKVVEKVRNIQKNSVSSEDLADLDFEMWSAKENLDAAAYEKYHTQWINKATEMIQEEKKISAKYADQYDAALLKDIKYHNTEKGKSMLDAYDRHPSPETVTESRLHIHGLVYEDGEIREKH